MLRTWWQTTCISRPLQRRARGGGAPARHAEDLHDLPGSRFTVTHRAWDGDICLMRWLFEAEIKGGLKLSFAV